MDDQEYEDRDPDKQRQQGRHAPDGVAAHPGTCDRPSPSPSPSTGSGLLAMSTSVMLIVDIKHAHIILVKEHEATKARRKQSVT